MIIHPELRLTALGELYFTNAVPSFLDPTIFALCKTYIAEEPAEPPPVWEPVYSATDRVASLLDTPKR